MKGGVSIAVDEINAEGGIAGKKLEVIYEDGKCIDTKSAVSAAQKLITIDKVNIILGGGCSNEALSIVHLLEESNTLLLSSGASSPALSGLSKNVFRNAPSDAQTGEKIAAYMFSKHFRKVAIVSDQTDYSKGFRDSFLKSFANLGGFVVEDISVSPKGSDYRTDLVKLKGKEIDAIFINPNVPVSAGIIARQVRELGMNQQLFFAYHATPDLVRTGGDAVNGAVIINVPTPENDAAKRILKRFEEKYGKSTVYPYNTLAAYDAAMLIAQGIKKAGSKTEDVRSYLHELKNFTGALGSYHFDERGDIQDLQYRFERVEGGKFVDIVE
ncbi:MAG: branched-chain amino acid transport system substrate-binding protein [Candidatus Taylorbacteria bacterium]|nr:branched-chain amino acid transport system substrate-binding protein [Candidatus Taylorbacteria bacterium]